MLSKDTQGIALDIDDTLSLTQEYWVRELHLQFGAPHSWEEIVASYAQVEEYPHWSEHKGALDWMDNARNSNEVQELIPLIENVHEIIQKVQKIVPIVAYITARPEGVREGTAKWLRQHNFPDIPLIMRGEERSTKGGSLWKAELLHELYPQVEAIVDDRPSLIKYLPHGYQGTVFLYNNRREEERRDVKVIECKTWDDVYTEVKKEFGN